MVALIVQYRLVGLSAGCFCSLSRRHLCARRALRRVDESGRDTDRNVMASAVRSLGRRAVRCPVPYKRDGGWLASDSLMDRPTSDRRASSSAGELCVPLCHLRTCRRDRNAHRR